MNLEEITVHSFLLFPAIKLNVGVICSARRMKMKIGMNFHCLSLTSNENLSLCRIDPIILYNTQQFFFNIKSHKRRIIPLTKHLLNLFKIYLKFSYRIKYYNNIISIIGVNVIVSLDLNFCFSILEKIKTENLLEMFLPWHSLNEAFSEVIVRNCHLHNLVSDVRVTMTK